MPLPSQFLGFSSAESEFRWTEGSKASISFDWPNGSPTRGDLFLQFDTLGKQHLTLLHNGVEVYSGYLNGQKFEVRRTLSMLPAGRNILEFILPGSRQPGNGDKRYLALALRRVNIGE